MQEYRKSTDQLKFARGTCDFRERVCRHRRSPRIRMEKGNFLQEFVAGNVGGLIGISVVYPLDTAKIRMQTHPHYKSTSDVLRTMIKKDGVKSLYRGLASPAVGFGLTFAISVRYHIMSLFPHMIRQILYTFRFDSTLLCKYIWLRLSRDSRVFEKEGE